MEQLDQQAPLAPTPSGLQVVSQKSIPTVPEPRIPPVITINLKGEDLHQSKLIS